ncbi:unnamed protein product, partial [Staurois parvus]
LIPSISCDSGVPIPHKYHVIQVFQSPPWTRCNQAPFMQTSYKTLVKERRVALRSSVTPSVVP